MKAHSEEFPIGKMAEIFKVSRCGYYEFLNRKPSKRASDNEALIVEIKSGNGLRNDTQTKVLPGFKTNTSGESI